MFHVYTVLYKKNANSFWCFSMNVSNILSETQFQLNFDKLIFKTAIIIIIEKVIILSVTQATRKKFQLPHLCPSARRSDALPLSYRILYTHGNRSLRHAFEDQTSDITARWGTSAGFGKSLWKQLKSFHIFLSNQKRARALTSTPQSCQQICHIA